MRTLGFRSHALLAAAAAVAVVAALGRPWYAPAPPPLTEAESIGDLHGPIYGLADTVGRWLSEATGTTGWDALGSWGTALAVLAAVAGVGALGCLVPALQGVAREALRYGGLACLGLTVWKLIDSPGAGDALELRYGAAVAVAAAVMLVACGSPVAAAPLRRRGKAPAGYAPPPPPPAFESRGSAPPPGR